MPSWKALHPERVKIYNERRRAKYRQDRDKNCRICGILLSYGGKGCQKHCEDCYKNHRKEIYKLDRQLWLKKPSNRKKDAMYAKAYRLRKKLSLT